MIKNIVFDLGRVLVDFNPQKYLEEFGLEEEIRQSLTKNIFQSKEWEKCDSGVYQNNSDLVDLLVNQYPQLETEIKLVLNKNWVKMLSLKEETQVYLEDLKKQGFKIYILSNLSEESYQYVKNYEFFKIIDGGVYSYQLKICKPNPKIYEKLLNQYKILPKETIFIDDNEKNIEMSEKLGMYGVIFEDLETVKQKVNNIIQTTK
ncbi:MAG: HAD family phosphatase [Clostridia bacterium]|nr:HAD family phosphatase [Clostridia bacterium]